MRVSATRRMMQHARESQQPSSRSAHREDDIPQLSPQRRFRSGSRHAACPRRPATRSPAHPRTVDRCPVEGAMLVTASVTASLIDRWARDAMGNWAKIRRRIAFGPGRTPSPGPPAPSRLGPGRARGAALTAAAGLVGLLVGIGIGGAGKGSAQTTAAAAVTVTHTVRAPRTVTRVVVHTHTRTRTLVHVHTVTTTTTAPAAAPGESPPEEAESEGPGSYSHAEDASFCSEHECIGDFEGEGGYVVECADGSFSHAGGISGACSDHGGESEG